MFPPPRGQKWGCCGRISTGKHDLGCIPSDHSTLLVPFNNHHDIPIPRQIYNHMSLDLVPESIIGARSMTNTEKYSSKEEMEEDEENYLIIRRYDWNFRPYKSN